MPGAVGLAGFFTRLEIERWEDRGAFARASPCRGRAPDVPPVL